MSLALGAGQHFCGGARIVAAIGYGIQFAWLSRRFLPGALPLVGRGRLPCARLE